MVTMQYFEKPKIVVLKGEEAVEVLNNYIKELGENKPEELTEGQTKAMIKLAEGLIQTIEHESSNQENKQEIPQLLNKLGTKLAAKLSQLFHEESSTTSPSQTTSPLIHDLPTPLNQQIR